MSDLLAWLVNWRDPWHWLGALLPFLFPHARRRLGRRERRRSLGTRLLMAVQRVGEAGSAELLLRVERLERAGNEARLERALEAKDREITELRRQLSESKSAPFGVPFSDSPASTFPARRKTSLPSTNPRSLNEK